MGISFIIPTKNEESQIADCINAIKPQLKEYDEIIVVDNGNTDNTNKIAQDLGCIVVKEDTPGLSNARNCGAKQAKNEILCFIDADGRLSRNWVKYLFKTLESNSKVVQVSGLNIFEHQNFLLKIFYNSYTVFVYLVAIIIEKLLGRSFFAGNNMAIKKEVFIELGGFEPIVGEDIWLGWKFIKISKYKSRFNLNMVSYLSSRRFSQNGFFKTIYQWIKDSLLKEPQVKYKIYREEKGVEGL